MLPTSEKYPQKQVLACSSPSSCCSASWVARAGVGGAGGGGEAGGGKVTSAMIYNQDKCYVNTKPTQNQSKAKV